MPDRPDPDEPVYRLLAEAAPNAIVVVDDGGRIVLVNAEAERLFGYRRGELLGEPVEALVPEALRTGHAESRAAFLDHAAARPMGVGRNLFGRRKDGSRFPVEIGLNPVRTGRGTLVLSAIVDISQRKQLERELQRRLQDLEAADRRKDEFLAILGHELRNPLAPIRNALSILRMPEVDEATVRGTHEMLDRQIEQLVRLVDDMVDVSRIAMGRVSLQREAFDLALAVSRGIEMAQPAAGGPELVVFSPGQPVVVEGDLLRLSQVVANLVTNAVKYTPPTGHIEISVRRDQEQGVVSVRDDGIGIAPELLPRVFDMFVRAENHAVRAKAGLGLGLTLVKRAVEMHGGSVSASSPGPGHGSEFLVRLPLSSRGITPRPREPAAEKPPAAAHRRRVLVVDDNVDAAESIGLILRGSGYDVRCAYTGSAALEMADTYRPQVIVLDIGLPDVTGWEVARLLRRRPHFETARVVAVTGYAQESDRVRSKEAGIDYHLTKPVDPKLLRQVIAEADYGRR
ncbi:MAG TPA: ATP-binding protein [Vicinamibacteria bacterium]|nr:ATP-binding protein [Vicinamibacteria bacterium]